MALNLSHLPKRKGAGLVRGLLPDIEAALHEGAALKDIHAVLQADHGLTITFNSFKVALHRVRKEKSGKLKSGPSEEAGKGDVDPVCDEAVTSSQAKAQAEAQKPKRKIGILSTKDIRPSPELEAELENLASKKYERK